MLFWGVALMTSGAIHLKRHWAFDGNRFVGDGMGKGQAGSMKIHAVGWLRAIKRITKNRHSQSIRMGTVDAQLMCATSKRLQPHSKGPTLMRQKLIVRNGLLAAFIIHYLTRTVIEIS